MILQYLHVEYVYALQFLEGRGAECDNPNSGNQASYQESQAAQSQNTCLPHLVSWDFKIFPNHGGASLHSVNQVSPPPPT